MQRLCAMHADGVNIDITKLENLKLELKILLYRLS